VGPDPDPPAHLPPSTRPDTQHHGGGPACLRLRVVADPATVDPRFIADEAKLDRIASVISRHWPETIAPADLMKTELWEQLEQARLELLRALDLAELA